ncbi:phospholipase D [Striga asiatica]|uniref:Phospholipase D n=1 Tax=Striga asiatica TaxID=4170 RepID=A0A5A7Q191_STRAF|nr:phospholipase D [Striga asiatica]
MPPKAWLEGPNFTEKGTYSGDSNLVAKIRMPIVTGNHNLDLRILEARNFPDVPESSQRLYRPNMVVDFSEVELAQAQAANSMLTNPVWNQHFNIPLGHPISECAIRVCCCVCLCFTSNLRGKFQESALQFKVTDTESNVVAIASVPVSRLVSAVPMDEWVPFTSSHSLFNGSIKLYIKFVPFTTNSEYLRGISENYETGRTYFPMRRGGSLTLYQDAHVGLGTLPEVRLDGAGIFRNEQCWRDICSAILDAKRLIYIMGWSIYHKVRLVREVEWPVQGGRNLTLGELLLRKSREGVRVLLLVWKDLTSVRKFGIHKEGLMETHDKETREYFKNSAVMCMLARRPPYYGCNPSILYSHHQKCVIVDTQDHGNSRKITAFIGGLDLCNGRYDTPEHRLYQDMETVFSDDHHNPSIKKQKKAPRQPWHDLHCKIEGPAAIDVLRNFEQRWRKVIDGSKIKRVFKRSRGVSRYEALLEIERDPFINILSKLVPNDPEQWHIQIFRSIDSDSVDGFPTNIRGAEEQNLEWTRNVAIDKSIHMAYVQAIRSAQHFIYIENQYFIGSSFAWPSDHKDVGANNLIPIELTRKIASKIRANERFSVYIVIPMWPEGKTKSWSVQTVLFWQYNTIRTMYNVVAQEIKAAGLEGTHPTDYLNFYCLGNREVPNVGSRASSSRNTHASASEEFKRFMIYVHSKAMIVDDAYILFGSANINQRSMAGDRDTEIDMGAYQPHHTWPKENKHPHGQIYGYRMSLWSEHVGTIEDCFENPETMECLSHVNRVAEDNWKRYTDQPFTPLQGHILKYPLEIDFDGNVKPMPGHENFPDVGGEVKGHPNGVLPYALTI